MGWESVSQLACVRRQIHMGLLQIINHRLSCSFISTKLRAGQICPLSVTGFNRPHQKVGNVLCDRLRKGGKFRCSIADHTGISSSLQREDIKVRNNL